MAISRTSRRRPVGVLITSARHGRSADRQRRERNYILAMTLRVVCFVGMILVPGWGRWVLLAAAAFLPGFAVLIANAVDKKGALADPVAPGGEDPEQPPTTPLPAVPSGEVLIGEVEHDTHA